MLHKVIDLITSLKLTIACLAAAMVLVLAGTFAQVHFGIHLVQQRYFQSLFVWWPPEGRGFQIPIFPGGYLVGGLLLINLIAAHVRRFQWTWRKLGIHLIHAGLIIMLAGGLFTDLFAVESHMRLTNGEAKNYSEDARRDELAVIDTTNPEFDQVTAIPEAVLRRTRIIEHPRLPFQIVVRNFFPNSRLQMANENGNAAQPIADRGVGAQVSAQPIARANAPDEQNVVTAVIEIVPIDFASGGSEVSLGTWLVSDALAAPQGFSWMNRTWQLVVRPARHYKPYSITLQKFTHERYAGTEIPRNFASRVTLIDPDKSTNRDVLIYMNHPLRYRGDTFYQAGFQKDDSATVLQVVHNPSFLAPYVACVIVAVGLLVQFGYHLVGFARRRRVAIA
jgi:ResB-like family